MVGWWESPTFVGVHHRKDNRQACHSARYVCWGLLHFTATYGIYKLTQNSPATMVQGRLMQTAFYLAAFAATATVLARTLNWRNDRVGFWVNGLMVGLVDTPFILFVLIPGSAPWWPGLLRRVFSIVAFSVTGLARMSPAKPIPRDLGVSSIYPDFLPSKNCYFTFS